MKIIHFHDKQYEPASHEDPRKPGVLKKMMMSKSDFFDGKPQMINWALLPAGQSFAAHYHEDMQEIFVIVKGNPKMEVGSERVDLVAGDTIVIDKCEVHVMMNPSDEDVEYVVVGVAGNANGKTVVVNQA